MAKTSKLDRQKKREALVAKHLAKRLALRERSVNIKLSLEERMEARAALDALPLASSPSRLRNRCKITGRPRGCYRRLGISRVALRRMAHAGLLPGLTKASW